MLSGSDWPRSHTDGHWPMYSNPVATWERIAEFHARNAPH
jgi:hypothetical protein